MPLWLQIALSSIGILFLIGFVNPYLLLPILVLSAIILKLQHFYLKTSRDLKRLEATSKYEFFFLILQIIDMKFYYLSIDSS